MTLTVILIALVQLAAEAIPWSSMVGLAVLLLLVTMLWWRRRIERRRSQWERARLAELEAYSWLDGTIVLDGESRQVAEQAKRVCRLVAEKSAFPRVALLIRGHEGYLVCVGSCGMNDLTLEALEQVGGQLQRDERSGGRDQAGRERGLRHPATRRGDEATKSFSVALGEGKEGLAPDCPEATIIPLRMSRGRLMGLLAVCTSPETKLTLERMGSSDEVVRALMPLEILAAKLARTVEQRLLTARLMEVERLAGAGQIVANVAHELSDPLTAVLGFAEMIAETSAEPRVRQDAVTIAGHATRMRETLRRLESFWKPRDGVGTAEGKPVASAKSSRVREVA